MTAVRQRLSQLLRLVEKEDLHLRGVTARLFRGRLRGSEQLGLDNLNRAHRLGLVQKPDAWLAMRLLRNRLVHEYVDDLAELNATLEQARILVQELHAAYLAIKSRSSILQS